MRCTEELLTYVHKIENPYLKQLTDSYFVENKAFIKAFKGHSAAKERASRICGRTSGAYLKCDKTLLLLCKTVSVLNKDLLLCAALFHDVGKMKEISRFPENDYTDDGQLLGHIVMGVELVGASIRRIPGFPKNWQVN